jgi:hypothetical protein
MGRPAVTSLVIDTEFWQADMPADQVVTWLASHTPAGLSPAGTSSSSGPSLDDDWAGFGYSDRANTAWQSAQLEVSVGSLAQSSTTSVIRADAVVVWLDPRPSPDNAAGQRARVTLAGGCPSSDAHLVGVTNPGAHLAASLLPAGAPTAALLCRYTGANGKTFALAHQARLGATAAQHLAKAVAKLPLSHVDGGVTSCPFGDGSAAVLAFSFPGRADVDLWVQTNGCATVANGYISTAAGDLPQLIEQYG